MKYKITTESYNFVGERIYGPREIVVDTRKPGVYHGIKSESDLRSVVEKSLDIRLGEHGSEFRVNVEKVID